jgi:hypothetical protein
LGGGSSGGSGHPRVESVSVNGWPTASGSNYGLRTCDIRFWSSSSKASRAPPAQAAMSARAAYSCCCLPSLMSEMDVSGRRWATPKSGRSEHRYGPRSNGAGSERSPGSPPTSPNSTPGVIPRVLCPSRVQRGGQDPANLDSLPLVAALQKPLQSAKYCQVSPATCDHAQGHASWHYQHHRGQGHET